VADRPSITGDSDVLARLRSWTACQRGWSWRAILPYPTQRSETTSESLSTY
jgi:hypothetical protein